MVLTPKAASFDCAAAPIEGGRRGRRLLAPERMVSSALGYQYPISPANEGVLGQVVISVNGWRKKSIKMGGGGN